MSVGEENLIKPDFFPSNEKKKLFTIFGSMCQGRKQKMPQEKN